MNEIIHSIRYPIAIDGGLGNLAEENNYERHVVQLMKQVLFTNPGERVNRPDFGCGIRQMVFAPNSDVNASVAKVMIFQSLERWLGPLIGVEEVKVKAINEKMEINIVYLLKVRRERRYLNLEITL